MSKETIAIVDATEKIGSAIARKLAQANYRLLLISTDEIALTKLSADIKYANPGADIQPTVCYKDGCWEADIIILTIPGGEEKEIAEKIREVATQKIIIHIIDEINTFSYRRYDNSLDSLLPYSKIVAVSLDANNLLTFSSGSAEAEQTVRSLVENTNLNVTIANHLIINNTKNPLYL